ncbi:3-ketosteroid-9-alpha-hydroxylase reductase subunit [Aquimixticola soesokkakensis]|uniref:3-ketosteroid-9-alpha-hydroxylase reductase subunit n=1 Tax=Aquimixticola soesokkakensis TaxID=1519096 RepID=A0A1Y5T7M8_9RHOB|nr:hybrid-cluster NAD(P)-dependent oxidoreductase [Aquimixticola soesokkakensis]SLN55826.1 3-ketosteroid-9-alpha-hydroxylase reductase subunit [Aquimixticola soesokkakensis]
MSDDDKYTEVTRVPLWDGEVDDTLVCRHVRQETHDVKTFVFGAREPRAFKFYPGQYMTFELPVAGMTTRSYTISASAARPYRIEITCKRVAGGPGSNWLHDNMLPGREIRVSGPTGDFTTDATTPRKRLFISAGSGITPMMSMTRTACDLGAPFDLHFVHAARSPQDLIFRRELELLAAQNASLKLAFSVTTSHASDAWTGYTGRLDLARLEMMSPDFRDRLVMCCGPAPFMAGVRAMLEQAGFDMDQYYEESFDFGTSTEGTIEDHTAAPEVTGQTFRVSFPKSGHVVDVHPGMTVLSAAREAGLLPMVSCQRGICGTCKSVLVSGEVEMNHGGGIRKREIDQGKILICCSTPLSDVEVEL